MKIELPDDAHVTVSLHAKSRAHVKDMQAQFPDAKWTHKTIPWGDDRGAFPIVKALIGKTTIDIFPKQRNADA